MGEVSLSRDHKRLSETESCALQLLEDACEGRDGGLVAYRSCLGFPT
jgi:hypothetical protein